MSRFLRYVGESYALEAGRRMNMPEHVLARAFLLLDSETRKIIALQVSQLNSLRAYFHSFKSIECVHGHN